MTHSGWSLSYWDFYQVLSLFLHNVFSLLFSSLLSLLFSSFILFSFPFSFLILWFLFLFIFFRPLTLFATFSWHDQSSRKKNCKNVIIYACSCSGIPKKSFHFKTMANDMRKYYSLHLLQCRFIQNAVSWNFYCRFSYNILDLVANIQKVTIFSFQGF